MNADRREEKPTERKSTEPIARICAIWQSVTGFRSSEGSTVDSLTTEILNKFFYLPCGGQRAKKLDCEQGSELCGSSRNAASYSHKLEFGVEVDNSIVITAVGNKFGGNFAKAAERALLDKKNNRNSFKYSCRFCIPGNCNSRGGSTSMRGMYEN